MPVPSPAEMQKALEMLRAQKVQQNAAEASNNLREDRKLAFARAVIREDLVDNTALDFHDGDVVAASKTLGIDLDVEVDALQKSRLNDGFNASAPAFRELGPAEQWPEPETRERMSGLCPHSIHLD